MNKNELNILWTNDNIDTSINMVLMYAKASIVHGFWEKINVIIWGATAKLVGENEEIRQLIVEAQEIGVHFEACIACAKNLGVEDQIRELDIDLKYMGQPLTDILKSGGQLLTI